MWLYNMALYKGIFRGIFGGLEAEAVMGNRTERTAGLDAEQGTEQIAGQGAGQVANPNDNSSFIHSPLFTFGENKTTYRQILPDAETPNDPSGNASNNPSDNLSSNLWLSESTFEGETILKVDRRALTILSSQAFQDINHFLRSSHLQQLAQILEDKEASENDRFVAFDLLKNANIAAGGTLPMCQDTGTALVMAKKGHRVWSYSVQKPEKTNGEENKPTNDEAAIALGIFDAYSRKNLRYSQLSPLSMFEEKNTRNNLPAQIEIFSQDSKNTSDEYHFLFIAKGGGSANKSFLFQPPPSILDKERMMAFLDEKIRTLGTAACPPYHLAIVIGGTSAELTLKTAKLASTHYLDSLPSRGGEKGQAFRDLEMEQDVLKMTQDMGIGAQFGGKYYCHDVRVIRLPRHGASLPIALSVSCSADRQALGKITRDGIFVEELEREPARFLPQKEPSKGQVVEINLNLPMNEIRAELSRHSIKTRLSLNGPIIVARDAAHARLRARIAQGKGLPEYFKKHPIYYAGPAKTPQGYPSGSFGPTTAGRMDGYVDEFQALGGSMVMLAKGNRAKEVRDACRKYGGFYLGSIGGAAARLAQDCIRSVETIEYPELGMEAIRLITVENFPAFIVIDDKGNDFFKNLDYRGGSDKH